MTTVDQPGTLSTIPARLDRLPWSGFHTKLVAALGVAWILDGLEITVASSVSGVLTNGDTLHMSAVAVASIATVYLIGEVVGALVFGQFADKWGRQKLFMVTLAVYLVGSGLSALTLGASTWWIVFLYFTRFVAGTGIGGEYAAINSAIDELIPSRYRGRIDVGVNGTYWGGSIIGTFATFVFINAIPESVGWRLGFLLGPVLGLVIIYVRRNLPESPRWQIMHGRHEQAEATVSQIEREVEAKTGRPLPPVDENQALEIKPTKQFGYLTAAKVLFTQYPTRSILGGGLMITQSFLYNAIFFTYALVLKAFFHVNGSAPLYGLAFAVGNLLGPLVLGRLFDTVGRRKMISGTYLLSGALLIISAILFQAGALNATTQTVAWVVIFFFASAGASAAYLTVSEIFPLEIRGKAIAVFFSIAQVFGALAALFYGALINVDNPDTTNLFIGYLVGAVIMIVGGIIAAVYGVAAERKSLEDIADPLGVVRKAAGTIADKARGPRESSAD